jgi:hypothetical protein
MQFYSEKYRITSSAESLTAAQMRFTHLVEKLLEVQKEISSAAKDALIELCLSLKELDATEAAQKYELLEHATTLLTLQYEK